LVAISNTADDEQTWAATSRLELGSESILSTIARRTRMSIGWSGRVTMTAGEKGRAAFVHVLRAATIAAVASSCSPMKWQSEPDGDDAAEENLPPPVADLPKDVADVLASHGFEQAQFVVVAYTDPEDGREKLISLQTSEPSDIQAVPEDQFVVPLDGTEFDEAIVIYTGSPASRRGCGRSSGGTRYCDFD
jgi:hypothetical protein